ncbi:MAG: hypothetical protein R3B82_20890 [Sandaracinaceae bacterium]
MEVEQLADDAQAFAAAARAERTRDAYRYQWARFEAWCDERGFAVLPARPTTIALYLTAWANEGATVATLGQALAAIGEAHRVAGHPPPNQASSARCGKASGAPSGPHRAGSSPWSSSACASSSPASRTPASASATGRC